VQNREVKSDDSGRNQYYDIPFSQIWTGVLLKMLELNDRKSDFLFFFTESSTIELPTSMFITEFSYLNFCLRILKKLEFLIGHFENLN